MLFASLLTVVGLLGASATPIEKRYSGVYIVSHRSGRCLTSNASGGNGAPVYLVDCGSAHKWDISPGSGSVIFSGTNLALDAGSNPGNNGGLKLWQSYPGLYQQTWYLTGDNRIAITGGNQCLDEGPGGIQTYQCTTGNTNQIFTISNGGGSPSSSSSSPPPSSTSSAPPPPSSSAAPPPNGIPIGKTYPDPTNGGRRIHFYNRGDLSLSVVGGSVYNGAEVDVTYSFDGDWAHFQLWDVPASGSGGLVRLHGTNFCLDGGSNPTSGTHLKVWQCYEAAPQQTWAHNGGKLTLVPNNQAIDVRQESGQGNQQPFPSLKDAQTWQSYAGNQNQQIYLF